VFGLRVVGTNDTLYLHYQNLIILTFHEDDVFNLIVQVRAINGAGEGVWGNVSLGLLSCDLNMTVLLPVICVYLAYYRMPYQYKLTIFVNFQVARMSFFLVSFI